MFPQKQKNIANSVPIFSHLSHGIDAGYLAKQYKWCPTTILNTIEITCSKLWLVLSPIVIPEPTEQDFLDIADKFHRRRNMPNCIGALDGKHIRIANPGDGSLFYNYKGYHSIVLMAACDSDYKFTMVAVGSCGSESDGGIFNKCWFGKKLLRGRNHPEGSLAIPAPRPLPGQSVPFPFYLIGDNAFPLNENIMRQYTDRTATALQRQANKKMSSARMYIENSFGKLKNDY